VQAAGDLSNLCRRVLASERRPGYQMLAHGQPPDEDGLEPDLTNEALGDRNRLRIVTRDRHPDWLARAMCELAQSSRADRIERAARDLSTALRELAEQRRLAQSAIE